ncbi:MAG: hypothetical protein HEQ29_00305 [Dolichospermum sp. LBC05a]|nr:hypothetical protein [Dolichospermum sp. OL01]MCO5795304.1 hypothetical protein [Dolichospermum sp. OL03]MCS6279532.1 hypothetical protein [Dolichospermum sp.]QSV57032.1 MAG: hypothetical protein HEQ29_00305 [Dolichospermum sp. LBC05a]
MINFGELEIKVNTKYSFVGIQKEGSKLIFHIPKGFSESDISLNTFDSKRDLFFRLYRVLNVFKQICIDKGHFQTRVVTKADDRDGVVEDDTGSKITSDNNSKNIFYSKIDALGSILDAYDELKILALVSRLGKSERIDYSKLHRYLNKAVFLNNGAIYIDAMNLPRKEIHFDSTDIVAMYCYILTEIKEQLKQQVNPEINSLAERFKEKYLGYEYSLFNEKYYLQVINELKDALELIDHYTPIKDSDYWDFYEAIYKFLFGELDNSIQGKVWGFSNFNTIWESMCLTYLVKTVNPTFILYLDNQFISSQVLIKFNSPNKAIDISNIFKINGIEIFPDAVIISSKIFDTSKNNSESITYKLKKDNFNDWYIYYTSFIDETNNENIKIAYANQSKNYHTFNELSKLSKIDGDNLISISSLPDKFYSYWYISSDEYEDFNFQQIQMMNSLNHVFFVAIKKGFLYFENFYEQYLEPYEILKISLLRGSGGKEYRETLFQKFIQVVMSQFSIIDIKYSDSDYYTNSENIEKIKSRSVRKQFVYEYLLQKHLEKTSNPLKELDIKSEFWLPASSNEETFTPLPKYMDDYIKLIGVNILTVIDSYLETEEK